MSEEIKLVFDEWYPISREELQKQELKQAIKEAFNEMDFRCPKCKCEEKDG
jgi:hypothetical protein